MIFDWYKLFLLSDFIATGLVSRTLEVNFEGIGRKQVLITKGNEVSITYENVLLPVEFLDNNPYEQNGYAVYKDEEGYIWLGVLQS